MSLELCIFDFPSVWSQFCFRKKESSGRGKPKKEAKIKKKRQLNCFNNRVRKAWTKYHPEEYKTGKKSVFNIYGYLSRSRISPGCSVVNNPPDKPEMWILSLGWEDLLEEKNGNPLQYSCLENSMEPGRLQSLGLQKRQTWLSEENNSHRRRIYVYKRHVQEHSQQPCS